MSEPDLVAELCEALRGDGWEPATRKTEEGIWVAECLRVCQSCGRTEYSMAQGPTEAAALEELAVACGVWPAKEGG